MVAGKEIGPRVKELEPNRRMLRWDGLGEFTREWILDPLDMKAMRLLGSGAAAAGAGILTYGAWSAASWARYGHTHPERHPRAVRRLRRAGLRQDRLHPRRRPARPQPVQLRHPHPGGHHRSGIPKAVPALLGADVNRDHPHPVPERSPWSSGKPSDGRDTRLADSRRPTWRARNRQRGRHRLDREGLDDPLKYRRRNDERRR
jgi:hypothetical protein